MSSLACMFFCVRGLLERDQSMSGIPNAEQNFMLKAEVLTLALGALFSGCEGYWDALFALPIFLRRPRYSRDCKRGWAPQGFVSAVPPGR